jgi:hypothetical protein
MHIGELRHDKRIVWEQDIMKEAMKKKVRD